MNGENGNSVWQSTRFRYAAFAGIFLALCLVVGLFVMPVLGHEPISDAVAGLLIAAIFGNGGVYTWLKTRENKTRLETNNHAEP